MLLNTISGTPGSRKRSKRVGRGNGSGMGTFATRGMNGQNSRSGRKTSQWFEGGQTPLFRRMPKLKGFSNAKFKVLFNTINVKDLEELAKNGVSTINTQTLLENNKLRYKSRPIKVLGDGEITQSITLQAHKITQSAQEKIQKAGGKVELI